MIGSDSARDGFGGFLTNVPFTSDAGGARRGLDEAIETFEYAESIGFDTATPSRASRSRSGRPS